MRKILLLQFFGMIYVAATDNNPTTYAVDATDGNPENRQNMFGFAFFFGQGSVFPFTQECCSTEIVTSTSTSTLSSTVTVSCTKSTNVACASGRRRRGILLDGEYEEQFPLSPSAVQGVEATLAPIQEVRYVDHAMLEMAPESQPQEIESTLQSGSFNERNLGSTDDRAITLTLTTTTTTTLFLTSTYTSTPICSQPSPFTQCPAQAG